jgi:hypothetical protein
MSFVAKPKIEKKIPDANNEKRRHHSQCLSGM